MKSRLSKLLFLFVAIAIFFAGCGAKTDNESVNNKTNHYKPYPEVKNIDSGMEWPEGQALPTFATPESTLDTILIQSLSPDEQITFSALQGLVNKKKPRILLLDSGADEGAYTWPKTFEFEMNNIKRSDRYSLIKKYADEVKGVILYDIKKSAHYRNLATTVAGIKEAIPVTQKVYDNLKEEGIELEVLEDLSTLEFTDEHEIYEYMYDNYYKDCNKRLFVTLNPTGDYSQVRDMAVATKSVVLWPNTREEVGKNILRKFFKEITPGEAVVLGWYTTERSGIITATEFGIGTMPADFYISSTVYSGMEKKIQIPAVPLRKSVEDKVYISIFISDGDNIQYMQRAMRKNWDQIMKNRGDIPLSWTVAPGMVDVGPGLLNYYYTNSTENDCFVTGPSGMGYIMPMNTLDESKDGAPIGLYLKDEKYAEGYAKLTETYLQRSGIRVVTIWDNASPMVRAAYEKNMRNLYGATVQDFVNATGVRGSVENDRVAFEKLLTAYCGSINELKNSITSEISKWDGNSPLFLPYQINIWSVGLNQLVKMADEINEAYPGKIEFVRADHYFGLLNEAKNLPFNLNMLESTKVTASDNDAEVVRDGTPVTVWEDSKSEEKWITFDFGDNYNISRYVIRHAGESGLSRENNTKDYRVLVSTDGENWETIDTYKGNELNVTDIEFDEVNARYVKIIIDNAGADSTARIADVEIYGKK